ncbi:luciferase family protein [Halobaculum lipolyticum]|uniref:Luciferase family protein n=1 Tax=Halobaculum lipolyticum TaxID=3032001 RepID=A0ABD5WIE7_9EURY|nr:luciferase family protein [Halobaculum sp. DT31]
MSIAQSIEQEIVSRASEWPGVVVAEKRTGATEFRLGEEDFGHIDDDGSLDLPLSTPMRVALVDAGRTEPHPVYRRTGWTTFRIDGEDDVDEAERLLRLAYVFYAFKTARRTGDSSLIVDLDVDEELAFCGAEDAVREAMLAVVD